MKDEDYMQRCLQLATLGTGNVAPNPMVGAVLVYKGVIIGEGYHEKFGEPHAEVNCINSVIEENRKFIKSSRLFVSLEPCAHFGKTPPCSQLIIKENIPEVIIGCRDSYKEVAGKGIIQLEQAGIRVTTSFLENECRETNKRFFTFHEMKRPYIILKWAKSLDGKIAADGDVRTLITNDFTNKLVHRWRREGAAILVGTNTALEDNPKLTSRLWTGKNPIRIVIDKELRLPAGLNVFNAEAPTIIFNTIKNLRKDNIEWIKISHENLIVQMLNQLYQRNIQSILIEGGAITIQHFIDSGLWDESRVITNTKMLIDKGVPAPEVTNFILEKQETIEKDLVSYYKNNNRQ
ncbi:MAG: bifunctional diaminohydroxyphosphoribosylaminopyrimidine deaminase/5-amino-6-(5-phosphoribosylamino)uracil reductase RibD [Ginsengibacter sp.]